jgi:uroporphyrinogen-III synthase
MHLIVTRPQPDAEELQRKLEVRGHRTLIAPLLDIRMGAQRPIPNRPYQAVLITSANGARALMDHPAQQRLTRMPALAVGPQSRAAAQAAGFTSVRVAAGDVASIAAETAKELEPSRGPLLYVSGEETSGDLEGVLKKSGFEVDRVIMYAAVPARELPAGVAGAIRRRAADGVLLYSRRTAMVWVKCIAVAGLGPYMDKITHFCLSGAVAGVIPNGWPTKTASNSSEQAMFELIANEARAQIEESSHGG